MSITSGALRACVAMAAGGVLLGFGAVSVEAAPANDAQGYVDSTARCAPPDSAVVFGSTSTSRIAVCKTTSGAYEYRGVRLSDGAKLIVPATAADGGFAAESAGITYTVTANALVLRSGSQVIRDEPMVDFHGDLPKTASPKAPAAAPAPAPAPAAPAPAAPAPSPTPTVPLPPPLPAEVGG